MINKQPRSGPVRDRHGRRETQDDLYVGSEDEGGAEDDGEDRVGGDTVRFVGSGGVVALLLLLLFLFLLMVLFGNGCGRWGVADQERAEAREESVVEVTPRKRKDDQKRRECDDEVGDLLLRPVPQEPNVPVLALHVGVDHGRRGFAPWR